MQNSDLVEGTQNFSRYCPNPSSVYITPCKHRKMSSIPFYKIPFPRKRRKTLCFWQMKGKWLVVIYIIVQKNFASSCLAKERVLFSLKMPADAKKLPYSMFVQIFQVSNLKVMVE